MCRSRRELSNEYLLAKFGFDPAAAAAENEPCKVCPLSAYRSPRYPVATKKSSGFKTPTTGFGAALAFLNVCSKISLYGYSSMALPPMGDMNAHKTSFAEQTLLLKILSEKVDGLAKTEQPSNYTHIHHIQGMHEFFEGKDPQEECRDEYELHLGYPDVTETMGEIPSEGFWGH